MREQTFNGEQTTPQVRVAEYVMTLIPNNVLVEVQEQDDGRPDALTRARQRVRHRADQFILIRAFD